MSRDDSSMSDVSRDLGRIPVLTDAQRAAAVERLREMGALDLAECLGLEAPC